MPKKHIDSSAVLQRVKISHEYIKVLNHPSWRGYRVPGANDKCDWLTEACDECFAARKSGTSVLGGQDMANAIDFCRIEGLGLGLHPFCTPHELTSCCRFTPGWKACEWHTGREAPTRIAQYPQLGKAVLPMLFERVQLTRWGVAVEVAMSKPVAEVRFGFWIVQQER